MKNIILVIIMYILGSVPFSYILVKLVKGVDIRTVGSRNVGATNAGRVLGFWGFLVAFLLDMSKSFVPLFILKHFCLYPPETLLILGMVAIFGHTFTIFLNFKGGKGVATAVGVYLAVSPISLGVAFVAFILVALLFRMVSLSSIIAAIVLLISVFYLESSTFLKIATLFVVVFVIYKHKDNIKRILNGTEKKIGEKIG
ncbi:glycerol-3-phosphate 1-O-acyltransferase PlsY [Calditerrivibrio nitroreducens]|uniref:Glycerol-3-phosphate acyltransferase n=1 Tax=Calditerrivibrio nitroreducens (strain DSM 19672 / NBRC 101217 / Yu37-1) TaxID=768670 RepID=E4TFJ5_CALNY|nr:glycerol-3-phosphate 1-O-acyltransferase PlsY [Calditerrivibrio nitroreducens]ADR19568.1 acyl-phosphate glycerol-3-phosphate acyltransferase [Calditerrivibrio nitroreducens DSM 19672]